MASRTTPLFPLEDVYVTGILAGKAGIQPMDHHSFTYFQRRPGLCTMAGVASCCHRQTVGEMVAKYRELVAAGESGKCRKRKNGGEVARRVRKEGWSDGETKKRPFVKKYIF